MTSSIALFVPSLAGGGVEKVMVVLANAFAERGFKVDLVLATAQGPFIKEVADEVRVIDLNASRAFTSLPGLVRYLRSEQPRALLSALHYANVIAVTAKAISRVSTRIIVSEHAHFSLTRANAKSIREMTMVYFMRWAYPRSDGVVAVSNGVADDLATLIQMAPENIHVVYNPVSSPDIAKRSNEHLCHSWFESEAPPVIIGVGRLTEQKNFSLLIRAFKIVHDQRPVHLIILGEGRQRNELERMVRELGLEQDVLIPGFQENPYKYMRRSSLFVLSSGWEGFGIVLVEAMACGVPVVSTDCPSGPAEILEDGKWGHLVPVGDIDAMVQAMNAKLDEKYHVDVAERAAYFGVEQAVEGYLQLLVPDEFSH